MHRGYIALYRKITDWEWYTDANTLRVYLHLLLSANWQTKKWRGQTIERGQIIIGVAKFGSEIGLSHKETRNALKKLEKSENIVCTGANKNTLVTLTNYDFWQSVEEKRASNGANKGQTKGKQRANKGQQLNHYNNDNNDNHEINNGAQSAPSDSTVGSNFEELIPEELQTGDFMQAWTDFLQHRKSAKKAVTEVAAVRLFAKMKPWGVDKAVQALDDSMANGWQGVFKPLKNKKQENEDYEPEIW